MIVTGVYLLPLRLGGSVRIDVVRDTSCLTMTDVTPADSGRYTVIVENELGRDTCSSSVTVDGASPTLTYLTC